DTDVMDSGAGGFCDHEAEHGAFRTLLVDEQLHRQRPLTGAGRGDYGFSDLHGENLVTSIVLYSTPGCRTWEARLSEMRRRRKPQSDRFVGQRCFSVSSEWVEERARMSAFRMIVGSLAVALSACGLAAQDRAYGRSVVASRYGIVATSQVAASQAGARVLEHGGSAIDAGIAANAVLNVLEPNSCGMGGDLFAIYWEAKTGKIYGINASGWAPKALTIEHLRATGITTMPQEGINSVTVPGV